MALLTALFEHPGLDSLNEVCYTCIVGFTSFFFKKLGPTKHRDDDLAGGYTMALLTALFEHPGLDSLNTQLTVVMGFS